MSVGAIYAYGATLKATSLYGAGLQVSDTLPLVPIEQLLLLGIKGSIQFGAVVLLAVLVNLLVFSLRASRSDEAKRPLRPTKSWPLYAKAGFWTVVGLGGVAAVVVGSIPMTLCLAAVFALYRLGERGRIGPGVSLVAMGMTFVLVNVGYELVDPDPLPRVILETKRHAVTGGLIATSDGMWWLAMGPDRYSGTPVAEVRMSKLRSPPHHTKSLLDVITGTP